MKLKQGLFAAVLLSGCLVGCRQEDQPQVVLYCSVDEHVARQVISTFQEQTGIIVKLVGDTEVKKTAGLVDRLRSEADNPQADVFWSSEIFMTIDLADEGVLDEHLSEATVDWPMQWRDRQRRWFAFAGRARVIVYAPDRVAEDWVPKTWMALTQSRFRGRIVMADPRFGTTGGHLGAMKALWEREVMPGYYEAYLEGLAENGVRILPSGNAGVVAAVASGEADLGMTDTDDVWAAQARGLNIKLVYPNHLIEPGATDIGTLLIPNTVARVRGGPNPEQASRLIDFLLSDHVERMLAESVSHNLPLGPGRPAASGYEIRDPLKVDYVAAAGVRSHAVRRAMRALSADAKPAASQPVESQPDASPTSTAPETRPDESDAR